MGLILQMIPHFDNAQAVSEKLTAPPETAVPVDLDTVGKLDETPWGHDALTEMAAIRILIEALRRENSLVKILGYHTDAVCNRQQYSLARGER